MPRRQEELLREVWTEWITDDGYGLLGATPATGLAAAAGAVTGSGSAPTSAVVNPAPGLPGGDGSRASAEPRAEAPHPATRAPIRATHTLVAGHRPHPQANAGYRHEAKTPARSHTPGPRRSSVAPTLLPPPPTTASPPPPPRAVSRPRATAPRQPHFAPTSPSVLAHQTFAAPPVDNTRRAVPPTRAKTPLLTRIGRGVAHGLGVVGGALSKSIDAQIERDFPPQHKPPAGGGGGGGAPATSAPVTSSAPTAPSAPTAETLPSGVTRDKRGNLREGSHPMKKTRALELGLSYHVSPVRNV